MQLRQLLRPFTIAVLPEMVDCARCLSLRPDWLGCLHLLSSNPGLVLYATSPVS